ncbi:MAG TPA: hypothetical protein VNK04_25170 [Gemmataceae bacterium]|nr:hypothetical protein [Gemmataceae bacterium]
MKRMTQLLACSGVGVLLVVIIVCLVSSVMNRPGLEWLNTAHQLQVLRAQQQRSEELDARLAEARRFRARQDEIAQEVAAGRMTLLEGAAHFRQLSRDKADFNWKAFRLTYQGTSDEERYCRQVIAFVASVLDADPSEVEQVIACLEAEMEAHRDRDGLIHLPDLPF